MKAALALAEDAPFRDLTVDEISSEAGISRSAFYLHFRDKHDLLLAALDQVSADLAQLADGWWQGEGSPAELVRRAISGVISVYGEHASLLRIAAEVSTYDEEAREAWLRIIERFIAATSKHIASEQRKGLITGSLDPVATAEALVWMAERSEYIYLGRGDRTPEEIVEQLTAVWIAALYPGVIPAGELSPDGGGGPIFGVPAPDFESKADEPKSDQPKP